MTPGLWIAAAVGLGLALGFGLFARRVWAGYPRPDAPLANLAPREAAFLAAAADAVFPAGGEPPASGTEAGVVGYLDRYVGALPASRRRLVRLLFAGMEHATLVFPGPSPRGRRRFSALDAAQQAVVLDAWAESRLFARRLAFQSLRALLTQGYLAAPAVLRALELAPLAIPVPRHPVDALYPRVGRSRASLAHEPPHAAPPSDGTPLDARGPLDPAYADLRR